MDKAQIKSVLTEIDVLQTVPVSQIEWLIDRSRVITIPRAEHLYQKDDPTENMFIVLEGAIRVYLKQKDAYREISRLEAGDITGVLPFSRLTNSVGWANSVVDTKLLQTSRSVIKDMIHSQYELTEALVHFMTNRVRSFTKREQQNEKLMSLGKLSAGLTHELNNPSAAIVRSSQALKKHLRLQPDKFKEVINIKLSNDVVDEINKVLFHKLDTHSQLSKMSLMEKTELEDELIDLLDEEEVDNAEEIASTLIDFGFSVEEIQKIKSQAQQYFKPILYWIENNLCTEKMVIEIEEASSRISDLVSSVKSYTHMDSGHDMREVCVHEGIRSTLSILNHKTGKNKVEIIENFEEEELCFDGYAGEINQIWTNILDNAFDALEDVENPKIEIKTSQDLDSVKIEITDNGPGIPEEIIDNIFDPFFTTKEVGKGTGMGLDVVSQIVNKHKGQVRVHSKQGKTQFSFCFPKSETYKA